MMKSDPQQEKRNLRLKIGRMRRRIDARLRATETEGRKLASWQTYVTRYPGSAVLAAFGLGLSGATFFASGGLLKGLSRGILRGSADRAVKLAWRELRRYWPSDGDRA
jgi:hypothetical protein